MVVNTKFNIILQKMIDYVSVFKKEEATD